VTLFNGKAWTEKMNRNDVFGVGDGRDASRRGVGDPLNIGAAEASPTICFERLFKSDISERDKFPSRLFGLFSEELVRFWCRSSSSPYEDLGRPTLKRNGERLGKTLDFTFRRRSDGRLYVGEMKCELEYDNYRCLTLTAPSQLERHRRDSDAFRRFLSVASNSDEFTVTVGGRRFQVDGAILVWGRVSPEGRTVVMREARLADVLALDAVASDLIRWNDQSWTDFVQKRATWCDELFSTLVGSV
jgi:hypothetical protein